MKKEPPNIFRRPRPRGDQGRGKGRGNIQPTMRRRYHGDDHHSPTHGFVDNDNNPWKGTKRIVDKPNKRRRNRASWRKVMAETRREIVSGGNPYKPVVNAPSTDVEGGGD